MWLAYWLYWEMSLQVPFYIVLAQFSFSGRMFDEREQSFFTRAHLSQRSLLCHSWPSHSVKVKYGTSGKHTQVKETTGSHLRACMTTCMSLSAILNSATNNLDRFLFEVTHNAVTSLCDSISPFQYLAWFHKCLLITIICFWLLQQMTSPLSKCSSQ